MLAVLDADSPVSMCLHMYRHWYCSLTTTHSARNHGSIFDEHLTFSDQISALSKSCYYHIRELHCICPYLHFKSASTIATSIVHSKLDYCNSLYHNLPKSTVNLTGSNRFKTLLLVLLLRLLNPHVTYHSRSQISPLAKGQRTHRI